MGERGLPLESRRARPSQSDNHRRWLRRVPDEDRGRSGRTDPRSGDPLHLGQRLPGGSRARALQARRVTSPTRGRRTRPTPRRRDPRRRGSRNDLREFFLVAAFGNPVDTTLGLMPRSAHRALNQRHRRASQHAVQRRGRRRCSRTGATTRVCSSLEEAVHLLTGHQAETFQLYDRGTLEPGKTADVVVFDPATIAPEAPAVTADLPEGGTRFSQRGLRHQTS